MNWLLSYGAAGMGDLLVTTMFLQDFAKQRPDDTLYFRFEIPYMQEKYTCIFDNNPYYHPYTPDVKIDKAVHFGWGEQINEVEKVKLNRDCAFVYTDAIYHEFNTRSGLDIRKTASKVDIYLTDEEKNPVVNTDKPLCVLNIGYNLMFGNSRNWGWSKFQYLVNTLKDKITFVQVGSHGGGYYHFPLQNCINLLDRSPLRYTFSLLNQAKFVLTHNSGTYHMASFEGGSERTVIGIFGGRDFYKFMDCYDIPNVHYENVYNNSQYEDCFESGKYCCDCGRVFCVGIPSGGNQIVCKKPSADIYGNVICDCFNKISPDEVIKRFEKWL